MRVVHDGLEGPFSIVRFGAYTFGGEAQRITAEPVVDAVKRCQQGWRTGIRRGKEILLRSGFRFQPFQHYAAFSVDRALFEHRFGHARRGAGDNARIVGRGRKSCHFGSRRRIGLEPASVRECDQPASLELLSADFLGRAYRPSHHRFTQYVAIVDWISKRARHRSRLQCFRLRLEVTAFDAVQLAH